MATPSQMAFQDNKLKTSRRELNFIWQRREKKEQEKENKHSGMANIGNLRYKDPT